MNCEVPLHLYVAFVCVLYSMLPIMHRLQPICVGEPLQHDLNLRLKPYPPPLPQLPHLNTYLREPYS